jgi:hypothetical protein
VVVSDEPVAPVNREPLLWDEAGNEVEPNYLYRQTELFRPEETFETNLEGMFPQIRDAIENYNRREGIRRSPRTYAIEALNRRASQRNREEVAADVERRNARYLRRDQRDVAGSGPPDVRVNPRQELIDLNFSPEQLRGGYEQEIIGGTFGALANDIIELNKERQVFNSGVAVEEVEELIKKYPELEPMLRNPARNEGVVAKRIDPKSFERYKQYADLEQAYSDPDVRAGVYQKILDATANKLDLGETEFQDVRKTLEGAESLYTSGDPSKQKQAREIIRSFGVDIDKFEKPAFQKNKPIIGGGGYVLPADSEDFKYIQQRSYDFDDAISGHNPITASVLTEKFPGLARSRSDFETEVGRSYFGPTAFIEDAEFDPDDPATRVSVNRGYPSKSLERFEGIPADTELSRNVLKFLRDNPGYKSADVSFTTAAPGEEYEFGFDAKELPEELKTPIMRFVRDASMRDRPGGTILRNTPVGSYDLIKEARDKGLDEKTSSYIRQAEPFLNAGVEPPSFRGKAYTLSGYGPAGRAPTKYQHTYIDREGQAVPFQLVRPEQALVGQVRFTGDEAVGKPAVPYKSQPRFYSTVLPGVTPESVGRIAGDIKRTPSSLLPGAADLIPSAEAIRRGYEEGPEAMGEQMARDFVAGLPVSAAAVPILSNPALAPFAPGIGAGLVGSAVVEAANEAVKQQTGKSLLTRFQEAMGQLGGDTRLFGVPRQPGDQNLSADQYLQRELDLINNPPQVLQR